MSAGFTPGPWVRFADTICKADERGTQKHIAYLAWGEETADAHLIAAAPELYEALVYFAAYHGSGGHVGDPEIAADKACAAIAKAKGEAQ